MHGKEHRHSHNHSHGGHRWHHDVETNNTDNGRHRGHGGHHGGEHRGGGRHGHGRHELQSGRKLSSSDLQLILLAQLAKEPAHGYELIKALEEHSHGLYVPSPGMIYPALTYLDEIGYASVETVGSKKRYSLTETGRGHYEQNSEVATRILTDMERIGAQMAQARQAMESGTLPEQGEYGATSEELDAARMGVRGAQRRREPYTAEESQRVAEILNRAAAEIRTVLGTSEEA